MRRPGTRSLSLVGRQQGPLLYTVTLLPGESVEVSEFDRYRRVRAAEQRLSVHSSLRPDHDAADPPPRKPLLRGHLPRAADLGGVLGVEHGRVDRVAPRRSIEDKAAELEPAMERVGDVLPRPFEDDTLYEAEL